MAKSNQSDHLEGEFQSSGKPPERSQSVNGGLIVADGGMSERSYYVRKPIAVFRDPKRIKAQVIEEATASGDLMYYSWTVPNRRTGRDEVIEGGSIGLAMCIARYLDVYKRQVYHSSDHLHIRGKQLDGILERPHQNLRRDLQRVNFPGPGLPGHHAVRNEVQDIDQIYVLGDAVRGHQMVAVQLPVAVPPRRRFEAADEVLVKAVDIGQLVLVMDLAGFLEQLHEEPEGVPDIADMLPAGLIELVLRYLGEVAGPRIGHGAFLNRYHFCPFFFGT